MSPYKGGDYITMNLQRINMADQKQWLIWLSQLQAIAQNGITYGENHFDIERYEQLRQLTAELATQLSDISAIKIEHMFAREYGYATPKLDVRAAIFRNNKILLVQEAADGKWSLPGGWADVGISAAETAVKEAREESGYEVKAVKLLALYDKLKHPHPPEFPHAYRAIFLCEIVGGSPCKSAETLDCQFFGLDELPELSVNRVTYSQIVRLFEHLKHSDWPTDFD